MSVSQYVFLHAGDLPSRLKWQSQLDAASLGLTLEDFDPATQAGYVPAMLSGAATGFELYSGAASELGDLAFDQLAGRDLFLEFVTHSDLTELKAAQLAAASLVMLADGIYYDGSEFRRINDVFELVREAEAAETAWKRQRAEKDAAISTENCPHCGAPCPSYRKTCKACGKPVRGQDGQ